MRVLVVGAGRRVVGCRKPQAAFNAPGAGCVTNCCVSMWRVCAFDAGMSGYLRHYLSCQGQVEASATQGRRSTTGAVGYTAWCEHVCCRQSMVIVASFSY